ncbi:endonuclease domain-containing protein [Brachybacterium vulturis]|uniref:endonuclease domain-containing protein n=1 Tax=Brachybacterium vulturis TaxID=2017484 RepID=UPI0037351A99
MRAIPLPKGVILHRDQWRELGVSSRRLAGDEFVRLFPGLHMPRHSPADLDAMCRALQQVVVPGAVLSHTTAAVLYGIPVPHAADGRIGMLLSRRDPHTGRRTVSLRRRRDDPSAGPRSETDLEQLGDAEVTLCIPRLHCRVPPGTRLSAGPHVSVHRMHPGRTRRVHGLCLSSPGEMLLELAQHLEHDEVVIALDHVLGPQESFGPLRRPMLRDRLAPYEGRRGYRSLLRALGDARDAVESPGETRTRLLLLRAGFPEPTPNLPVRDPDSGEIRRLDIAYPELKIAIEYDGDIHRSRNAWRQDQARQDSLESVGWTFRRLTMTDIREPARFLDALRRSVVAAGAPAPPATAWAGPAARMLGRPRPRPEPVPRPRRQPGTRDR